MAYPGQTYAGYAAAYPGHNFGPIPARFAWVPWVTCGNRFGDILY